MPTTDSSSASPASTIEKPLPGFSDCHAGILARLRAAAADLPQLLQATARAKQLAHDLETMFEGGISSHHADEEQELFPCVLRSARPGVEQQKVRSMVDRLVGEHRDIEALYRQVQPALHKAARGGEAELDAAVLRDLLGRYVLHARYEEQEFLPLAQEILGRSSSDMAALGISLHLRHAHVPAGYV